MAPGEGIATLMFHSGFSAPNSYDRIAEASFSLPRRREASKLYSLCYAGCAAIFWQSPTLTPTFTQTRLWLKVAKFV